MGGLLTRYLKMALPTSYLSTAKHDRPFSFQTSFRMKKIYLLAPVEARMVAF